MAEAESAGERKAEKREGRRKVGGLAAGGGRMHSGGGRRGRPTGLGCWSSPGPGGRLFLF
jgi:hypothetical protein